MLRSDPARDGGTRFDSARFVLYVEGPRDRDILRIWARRVSHEFARRLERSAFILGGCRPARAVEHFRRMRDASSLSRGLCVLDRDGRSGEPSAEEPGLEFFTWPRRHIESYLLVPGAIRRCLPGQREDPRVERLLRDLLPTPADEQVLGRLDAKRMLAPTGALSRELGHALSPGRIARAMHRGELHDDVHELFGKLREAMGLPETERSVVQRTPD
jgi:hypothetical protein